MFEKRSKNVSAHQRAPVGIPIPYLDIGEKLTAGHHQEVHIEEKLELLEEDQWDECNNVIFLVFDHIWREFASYGLPNSNFPIT